MIWEIGQDTEDKEYKFLCDSEEVKVELPEGIEKIDYFPSDYRIEGDEKKLIAEEKIAENHALMMYEPLIDAKN